MENIRLINNDKFKLSIIVILQISSHQYFQYFDLNVVDVRVVYIRR